MLTGDRARGIAARATRACWGGHRAMQAGGPRGLLLVLRAPGARGRCCSGRRPTVGSTPTAVTTAVGGGVVSVTAGQ